jgi:hypothetical protein
VSHYNITQMNAYQKAFIAAAREGKNWDDVFDKLSALSMADMLRALDLLEDSAVLNLKGRFGRFKRVRFACDVVEFRWIPGLPNLNSCPDNYVPNVPGEGSLESNAATDAWQYLWETRQKFAVWAQCFDTSGDVNPDGSGDLTTDSPRGQAGWDVGLKFYSLTSLCNQLETLVAHRGDKMLKTVRRLAIRAHGDAGMVALNGKTQPAMNWQTMNDFAPILARLLRVTTDDATVLFMGCLAGKSNGGTDLLTRVSTVLRGRTIVGYATIGYAAETSQRVPGTGNTYPGMRDSNETEHSSSQDEEFRRYHGSDNVIWNDLTNLPWASETSPHAKVAKAGQILRGSQL